MQSYRDLIVWQKAMDLVEEVYKLVKHLPKGELYVLSDQLLRAVVSIPSKIAEGYGRNSTKKYARYLNIARGSKHEVEPQLLICTRLNFMKDSEIQGASA